MGDEPFAAANGYLGDYRLRIELNTDLPVNLARLSDLLAHEAYPGHHTELVLKEEHLYREGATWSSRSTARSIRGSASARGLPPWPRDRLLAGGSGAAAQLARPEAGAWNDAVRSYRRG